MEALCELKAALTPSEWRRVSAMAGAVVLLHVLGYGTLLLFVVPRHFSPGHAGVFGLGLGITGLGLGITAYTLGLRHAFDADHISAIDKSIELLSTAAERLSLHRGFWGWSQAST